MLRHKHKTERVLGWKDKSFPNKEQEQVNNDNNKIDFS